jgi:hypothetical protein
MTKINQTIRETPARVKKAIEIILFIVNSIYCSSRMNRGKSGFKAFIWNCVDQMVVGIIGWMLSKHRPLPDPSV